MADQAGTEIKTSQESEIITPGRCGTARHVGFPVGGPFASAGWPVCADDPSGLDLVGQQPDSRI